MNQLTTIKQSTSFTVGKLAELCINHGSRKKDEFWVEAPSRYSTESFPSLCQIDMWGEKTCSTLDDYPHMRSKAVSCTVAYAQDKGLFELVRSDVQSENWTKKEMKKVLQWVLNCSGKLPVQTCAEPL